MAHLATLQTIPGAARGNVNLLAPRGTVDAGAAGIRVSGNLNVADARKKRRPGQVGYNPSSEVLVLGFGKTGDSQRAHLTREEQSKLGGI